MTGRVAALVVAAGRGSRAGGDVPKAYRSVGGAPVIVRSLALFTGHKAIELVQPVIHPDDRALFERAVGASGALSAVGGGATRQQSVHAGLRALTRHAPDRVLVHDAARPFASIALIARAVASTAPAAVPAIPAVDTLKRVDAGGRIVETIARDTVRIVQTPQVFDFATLLAAHERAAAAGRDDFSDDAALAEWAGIAVTTFDGEAGNVKLTTNDDFLRAERDAAAALADIRTGQGFDVHAFGDGDHVTIGGIAIPHSRGLTGHSDADVGLHALVDAILGALADGDIGQHFPPTDPKWRGASSDQFLSFAVERVRARGGQIALLDLTIICEAPRVGPHRDAMRRRIAEITGISIDRVAVKATTSEGLGFTGRREGIAAMATATLRLPWGGA
jgi:2-C-methyl-D-erythritol 4-phosphate cytidylyltransferase/2-C-methyl-D-erythritol 2,4-cyclodiphosphate synthase